jgi:RNA 3'-terminal phosphate cyclase (ATP)
MQERLTIDGSFGEGGGQILRTSLSLSALTRRPIRIENIRAGRKNPGLQPQHLASVRGAAKICGGRASGDKIGSTVLEFYPGETKPGSYAFDVSEIKASAGSIGLVFQTIFWPLVFARKGSSLVLRGGTHVNWSPVANYIDDVFLPTVSRMGALGMYSLKRAGYYPVGGGEIHAEVRSTDSLRPLNLSERGQISSVYCYSAVSNLTIDIARRQLDRGLARLSEMGISADGELLDVPSPGKGTYFFILAKFGDFGCAGFTGIGERGKPAEKVAEEAVIDFEKWYSSGMAIDPHLADQLIIPMALADGPSVFSTSEITQHLVTNITVVRKFLDVEFEIQGEEGLPGVVKRL